MDNMEHEKLENQENALNKGGNGKNIVIIILSAVVIALVAFLVVYTVVGNREEANEVSAVEEASNVNEPTFGSTETPHDHGHTGHNHLAYFTQYEVTIGNVTFSAQEYATLYEMFLNSAAMFYGMFSPEPVINMHMPFNQQRHPEEDMTWDEYLQNEVISIMRMYAAANAAGYYFTADDDNMLNEWAFMQEMFAMEQGWNMDDLVAAEIGAITWQEYLDITRRQIVISNWMGSVESSISFTTEQMEEFFHANWEEYLPWSNGELSVEPMTVDARHILIMNNQDETAGAIAQDILDEWLNGAATEDSFAALAGLHTEDPGSAGTGGLYQYISRGQMVPEFDAWIFDESRAFGDYGIVETSFGFHIMFFVTHNEAWVQDVNNVMMGNAIQEIIDGLENRFTADLRPAN